MTTSIAIGALAPTNAASGAPPSSSSADFMAASNRALPLAAPPPPSNDAAAALLAPFSGLSTGSNALAQQTGTISSGTFKPSDVMELTLRAHEFMFRCELTATVANRSSDGIQTLFRQQA